MSYLDKIISDNDKVVVTRSDFVDNYLGWTRSKTRNLLEKNVGKILVVEGPIIVACNDSYGHEAS